MKPFTVMLALLAALVPVPRAESPVSLEAVLSRFSSYLTAYADEYSATIAREHYTQTSGRQKTVIEAEFGVVRLSAASAWLGFRDVVRVDGKPVTDRETRLATLFASSIASAGFSRTAVAQATRIVEESARFNAGNVKRTINNPALVLELLDSRHHRRFRFDKEGEENTLAGGHVWRVRFAERSRPTIVRTTGDRDIPAEGELRVDPETGRLHRADVTMRSVALRNSAGRVFQGIVSVTFAPVPGFRLWLPATMTERYDYLPFRAQERDRRTLQTGEATYTDYRRFQVETRDEVGAP